MDSTLTVSVANDVATPPVTELIPLVLENVTSNTAALAQTLTPTIGPPLVVPLANALFAPAGLVQATIDMLDEQAFVGTVGDSVVIPAPSSGSITPVNNTLQVINATGGARQTEDSSVKTQFQRNVLEAIYGWNTFGTGNATKSMASEITMLGVGFSGVSTQGQVSYALATTLGRTDVLPTPDFLGTGVLQMNSNSSAITLNGGLFPSNLDANYVVAPNLPRILFQTPTSRIPILLQGQ